MCHLLFTTYYLTKCILLHIIQQNVQLDMTKLIYKKSNQITKHWFKSPVITQEAGRGKAPFWLVEGWSHDSRPDSCRWSRGWPSGLLWWGPAWPPRPGTEGSWRVRSGVGGPRTGSVFGRLSVSAGCRKPATRRQRQEEKARKEEEGGREGCQSTNSQTAAL